MSDPRPTYPQGPPAGAGPQQPVPPGQPAGDPAPAYGHAPDAPQPPPEPKHPVSVGQVLGGLLFLVVIVFIAENTKSVDIRLIGPVVHAPLFVAILIAAVLGALTAWLLRFRRARGARRRQEARQYRAARKRH